MDRYNAFFVILGEDIRDDEAQAIMQAAKMIKGVLDVNPHIATPDVTIATTRAKREALS